MISIVVPVYNIEKYIGACIESVIRQTYRDWELLVVIDGATDRSADICMQYQQQDPRVRVLCKPNGGVSSARNMGITQAKGEFIMFVDGDDWLEEDALESMYSMILERNVDACYCRTYYKDDSITATAIPRETPERMSAETAIRRHLRAGFVAAPWLAMTRLSKVKDVLFNESIHALEDWEYNFRQLTCLETLTILDKPVYHYRTVVGSASKSALNDRKLTCFLIPEAVCAYIRKHNLPYAKEAEYVPIFLIYHMLVILANGKYNKGPAKVLRDQARKNLNYAMCAENVSLRNRIYILLAAITPRLFCLAYHVKYRGREHG